MKLKRKSFVGQNKMSIYLILIFFVSIFIGVGYSYLNSNLSISGVTTITKSTWDIHFENLNLTSGSVAGTSATIENNATLVNFEVSLENPGEYYEFTVDVVNAGTIDAMLSSVVNTGLAQNQASFLEYIVTYSDGTAINEKDLLSAKSKETIKVKIKYRDDVSDDNLPSEDQYLDLQLSLIYVQADGTAVAIVHPTCKRATTLHTETCTQTNTSYYCGAAGYTNGSTITYGNLGTSGTLTSGDAFDCDVNGDGTFDSSTERFYYVSDLDTDNNYAVLIYYNNVSDGKPNNTVYVAYDTNYSTTEYFGPRTAMLQLPTTTQWKNVSLSNTTRDIKDEKETVRVTGFSYKRYASRLLTAQELNRTCGITVGSYKTGELDTCQYLMENTQYSNSSLAYGYWLESPLSSNADMDWSVNGSGRSVYSNLAELAYSYGVRPAIEVQKNKIDY